MKILTKEITCLDDIETFFNELLENDVNFHPDTDFNEYINLETLELTFTKFEALRLNILMNDCFEICEAYAEDIYEIAIKVFKENYEL